MCKKHLQNIIKFRRIISVLDNEKLGTTKYFFFMVFLVFMGEGDEFSY